MRLIKPVKILGFGKYLPPVVTSAELEERYGLPIGWSEKHSGVNSRHHAVNESNGYMGARAIEFVLTDCGLSLCDIDMIICASATYDYPIPNGASMIKSELKDGHKFPIAAIDIDSTCLSFVTALEFASSLLNGQQYRKIIIVSSEIASMGLNPANWEVLTLFGDGAVAAIVEYNDDSVSGFIKGANFNYCEGIYDTIIKGAGSRNWQRSYDQEMHSFTMNGKNLLKLAKTKIPEFIDAFFKDIDIKFADIDAIVPHQASKTGIHMFRKHYGITDDRFKETLSIYGNCIAASIPLTFYNAIEKGEIKRGDLCFLFGTSAGFSIGGALIRY